MTESLFDAAPLAVEPPPPPERISADRRRTLRQATAITHGAHPLALLLPRVRLHPDADRNASADDPRNLPLRCGSCALRQLFGAGNRTVPKCTADDRARMTHSAATDVRAWWPACTDYEAGAEQ